MKDNLHTEGQANDGRKVIRKALIKMKERISESKKMNNTARVNGKNPCIYWVGRCNLLYNEHLHVCGILLSKMALDCKKHIKV